MDNLPRGHSVKAYLQKMGITQKALTKEWANVDDTGKYQPSLSNLLNSDKIVSLTLLQALSNLTKTPLETLIEAIIMENPVNNSNKVFEYNGTSITFQLGNGDVMVNATEMAKPFGKRPAKWLELSSTRDFIEELSNVRKSDNWIITERGHVGGTWMHEDVAIEFARWLNPSFAIWCNDRIKELIKHGVTALPNTIEDILSNPDVMINALTELKKVRAEKAMFQRTSELQEQQLRVSAPKVDYFDHVLQSEEGIPINKIAKELEMSGVTLNRKLRELGVQYYQNGTWLLYAKYQSMGLTKTKTHHYTDEHGVQRTNIHTYWTEKGRLFIHNIMKDRPKNKVRELPNH